MAFENRNFGPREQGQQARHLALVTTPETVQAPNPEAGLEGTVEPPVGVDVLSFGYLVNFRPNESEVLAAEPQSDESPGTQGEHPTCMVISEAAPMPEPAAPHPHLVKPNQ